MSGFTTSGPLDATVYLATGARLWAYDNFYCLRELSPPGGCPSAFTSLEFSEGWLFGSTEDNIFSLSADPAAASCGTALLVPTRRAITGVRATGSALYFTDGGVLFVLPRPQSRLAPPQTAAPRPLLQPGADLLQGQRLGLAVWQEAGVLFYGARGEFNGTPGFKGILAATTAGDPLAGYNPFFAYSSDPSKFTYSWSVRDLAIVPPATLLWSEIRGTHGTQGPGFAVQRTELTPPAFRGEVKAQATGGDYVPEATFCLTSDSSGVLGGALWYALNATATAFSAGPLRQQLPLLDINFEGGPFPAPVTISGLAFAPGSTLCGYPFAYEPGTSAQLLCAPRSRTPVSTVCGLLPPALVYYAEQTDWRVGLGIAVAVLTILSALLYCCLRRCCPLCCISYFYKVGLGSRASRYAILADGGGAVAEVLEPPLAVEEPAPPVGSQGAPESINADEPLPAARASAAARPPPAKRD